MRKLWTSVVVAVLAAVVAASVAPRAPRVRAADAGDASLARIEGQLDLCDVFAFTSPEDAGRTILILTASPFAGTVGSSTFATKATYNLCVDTTGDYVEDDVHTFSFSAPALDGTQTVNVSHRGRGAKFKSKGTTGAAFTMNNGTRVQCGVFDDPAFFDVLGARKGNLFSTTTSRNFFHGVNVLGIVVDVANGEFGPHQGFRVWATTTKGKARVDRVGRPGLSLLLFPAAKRDGFNAGRPKDDRSFQQDLIQKLVTLRGGNYTGVSDLALALLPDVLPFVPGDVRGFADGNGRQLGEDVMDQQLALITDDAVTTDHVANDSTFLPVFPYLGPANP